MKTKASPCPSGTGLLDPRLLCLVAAMCLERAGTPGSCASVHSERKVRPPVSKGLGFESLLEQECLAPPGFTAFQRREASKQRGWACAVASLVVSGDHGVLRPSASGRRPVGPRNDADSTEGCHGHHSLSTH